MYICEVKKSKCENHIKWSPKICQMMRGFQIQPQNSNQIIFDAFWPKYMVDQNGGSTAGPKGGQMSIDLNFDAIFEILSSFSIS